MNWYNNIKLFYIKGYWNIAQVWDAVSLGKIIETQYAEITGESYPTERPVVA